MRNFWLGECNVGDVVRRTEDNQTGTIVSIGKHTIEVKIKGVVKRHNVVDFEFARRGKRK